MKRGEKRHLTSERRDKDTADCNPLNSGELWETKKIKNKNKKR
jgi:hypothetical protein